MLDNKLHIESFLEMMLIERNVSKNTRDSYHSDLEDFMKYCQSHSCLDLKEVDINLIRSYIASLSQKQMDSKTIARRISALRQFYNFLFIEKLITNNPATNLELPKIARNLPNVLSETEVKTLIEASYQDSSSEGIRLSAMLELLYASGLRVSELISLKISDLQTTEDQNYPYLIIKGKGSKERIVVIHEKALDILKKYLGHIAYFTDNPHETWLFPSKLSKQGYLTRQYFAKLLKKLALSCNIDPDKLSPHKIRHSFATHMLSHGADLTIISELLGHKDISTTQIYTHVSNQQLKSMVFNLHPLNKK